MQVSFLVTKDPVWSRSRGSTRQVETDDAEENYGRRLTPIFSWIFSPDECYEKTPRFLSRE